MFGNIVLDFMYRGNKSLNRMNLQNFIKKENYEIKFDIQTINLLYPETTIKYKQDGKAKSISLKFI